MVSQGIEKKTKGKSMGASVRQGSLFVECSEIDERLGKKMPVSSKYSQNSFGSRSTATEISADELGRSDSQEYSQGIQQDVETFEKSVVCKNMFSSERAAKAFCELTDRQQEYLKIYFRTLSPTSTAQELGLRSTKSVGKEIKRLAKRLGFASISAMKKDVGITADKEDNRAATSQELMQLLQQQAYRCALTGKLLTPQTARLDHKCPVSQGGSHDVNNLHWVLETVNTAKGTMKLDEFVGMCIDVAKWAQL